MARTKLDLVKLSAMRLPRPQVDALDLYRQSLGLTRQHMIRVLLAEAIRARELLSETLAQADTAF